MLQAFFSTRLELEEVKETLPIWPILTLSFSYGPNQGFELAVPGFRYLYYFYLIFS